MDGYRFYRYPFFLWIINGHLFLYQFEEWLIKITAAFRLVLICAVTVQRFVARLFIGSLRGQLKTLRGTISEL